MLSDINALEQFPGEIARGRGAKEIGDHQSNRARYPEKHGLHFDVLNFPSKEIIYSLTFFDRYGSFASILACPQHVRLGGNPGNAGCPVLRFEASVWT